MNRLPPLVNRLASLVSILLVEHPVNRLASPVKRLEPLVTFRQSSRKAMKILFNHYAINLMEIVKLFENEINYNAVINSSSYFLGPES